MKEYKEFSLKFESEKITSWEKSYIDYNTIVKKILELFRKKKEKDVQTNFENINQNNIIYNNDENNISNNDNNNKKQFNDINSENKSKDSSSIKEEIKSFFQILDKEVKKLNIFYSSKEKDIYQNINKKIQNISKIKEKSCNEILKEIEELNYLDELCLQVLLFIYLNIKALKSILSILDNSLNTKNQSISYKYIKRFLSKNNSDLIYILSFKTLDETILSIQGILDEYKNSLESNDEYKDKIDLKNKYKIYKKKIKDKNLKFDEIHEKIFSELTEWKKYLDTNLDLPSSSKNSIFKGTPFVGDLIEKKSDSKPFQKGSGEEIENQNEDSGFIYIKTIDTKFMNSLKNDISEVFKDEEEISNLSNKILSKKNISNFRLLYILTFFYSYSYFVIIPKILYILENKISDNIDYKKFYGIIISLPSLGSLISQLFLVHLIKYNFKFTLIISLICVLLHYSLFIIGIVLKKLYLLFLARFLLGLSSIERICKIYIYICIPEIKQAKSNRTYLTLVYIGYIIGLLLGDLEIFLISFFSKKKNDYNNYEEYEKNNPCNEFEFLYLISGLIFAFISISVFVFFSNPSSKKFKKINDDFAEFSKENRLITKFLDNEEKKAVEKQEKLFENANKLMSISNENQLKKYSNEVRKKESFHFTKVYLLLLLCLITSQYTSENNLMLIPRLFELEKNNTDYNGKENYNIKDDIYYISYIGNILFSSSFLISLLVQKCFLKNIFFKKSIKKYLLIFFFICIIFILSGIWPYFESNYNVEKGRSIGSLFPILGNFFMIIISEVLMIIIVNLFLGLLPDEKMKFLCLRQSSLINVIDKLSRLLPGIIYMIMCFINNDEGTKSHLILLGIELIFVVLSIIFCLIKGNYLLKSHSLTRLYCKN